MTTVRVTRANDDGHRFLVDARDDDGSTTTCEVDVPDGDWERFGRGYQTREQLVETSFAFLLEREPKESILRSFELGVIARYFPEYPAAIAERAGD